MNPIVQITKSDTILSGTEFDLEQIKSLFKKQHFLKLPGLLSPDLLDSIQRDIDKAEFYILDHGDAGLDLRMVNNSTNELLHALINENKFLRFLEQVTGYHQIKYFTGRVYKMIPGEGHYDIWHTDLSWSRVLTMSINLSNDIYSGGILKIRNKKTKEIIAEVSNTGFGDAIIFPISEDLEHMVTEVESNVAKIAFAGWLSSKISIETFSKDKLLQLNENNHEIAISLNSTVVALKGLLTENINNQLVIFNPICEMGFGLDSLGEEIWKLIQIPVTVRDIQDHILKKYSNVNPKQCEKDIILFLVNLKASDLISSSVLEKELV